MPDVPPLDSLPMTQAEMIKATYTMVLALCQARIVERLDEYEARLTALEAVLQRRSSSAEGYPVIKESDEP